MMTIASTMSLILEMTHLLPLLLSSPHLLPPLLLQALDRAQVLQEGPLLLPPVLVLNPEHLLLLPLLPLVPSQPVLLPSLLSSTPFSAAFVFLLPFFLFFFLFCLQHLTFSTSCGNKQTINQTVVEDVQRRSCRGLTRPAQDRLRQC